jgi:4-oxalocrotonate tautomerase
MFLINIRSVLARTTSMAFSLIARHSEKVKRRKRLEPSLQSGMEEPIMPLIQVNLMEEVFTPSKKKEVVSKLTNAVVPIEGENMRPVAWVSIEEVCSGEWSIVGQAITTEAVRTLAADKK